MPEAFRITTWVFENPNISAAECVEDKKVMVSGRRPYISPRTGDGVGGLTIYASVGINF